MKTCWKCKRLLVAYRGNFVRDKRKKNGLASICKECKTKASKEYYEINKEMYKEKYKEKYKENNKESNRKSSKKYRENHPEVEFNQHAKRRIKEENQGRGISKEQWLEMMEFFDWKCAYSGKHLGDQRTIDHIISLKEGGEHEAWNCVPMLKTYNCSKNTTNFMDWYIKQDFFDIDRLLKIYEWIEYAYNKWK